MIDLYEIADILDDIRQNGSSIYKESALKENEDVEGFKEVLKFIYDPSFTTGLKVKKIEKAVPSSCGECMSPEEFMNYLKVNNTGTDSDATVACGFIYSYDTEEAIWLAEGIATKDLQIGVSITTLNKVFGKDFIPKIGIMRGMLCPDYISGYYIATEKIDGNRRLIFNKESGVEIYTRSGKRDYGLVELEEQARLLPVGYVYDTECTAMGDFKDSIELRQASASLLNSKGIRRGVRAQCFDMLRIEKYNVGRSVLTATARKAVLAAVFKDYPSIDILIKSGILPEDVATRIKHDYNIDKVPTNIEVLPILGVVHSKPEAIELAKPIWERGGEGVMLVEHKSAYEVSPNPRKTLLKIKLVNEYTCKCINVVEGDNKYAGMLGAIEIAYKRPGDPATYTVKVGSGFTDYQRQAYWEHPELIIHKMVEIDSFGESKNAQGIYSLNCPIFKRIVGETE